MSEQAKKIILEISRLGLRYLGTYLVVRGWFDDETAGFFSDPMAAEFIGGVLIAGAEYFFVKAKVKEVTQ